MEIEKVIEMSLDEYIDTKKSANNNHNNNGSSFKAERRKYDDDDAGEDLIWKGPDEKTNYLDLNYEKEDFDQMFEELSTSTCTPLNKPRQPQQHGGGGDDGNCNGGGRFDLRERISGSSSSMLPPVQSQQWRLMHPNVGNQRPAGMPPLVPQDVSNRRQDNNNINRRQRSRYNNYGGGGNWGKNKNGYNNCFNNGNNYRNNGGGYNNGRVQRINQQQQQQQYCNNQQMILNHSLKAVLDKLSSSNTSMTPPQVTIEVPSETLDLRPGPPTNFNYGRRMPQAAAAAVGRAPMTAAAVAASNLENNNNAAAMKNNGAEGIKALLGIGQNVNNEMMPMLASKILDLFQNCTQQTVHKPMYDMKLQKEIHDLQNKSLMYSCPGGEVVSSDGSGINNCEIIPRTSGVSMNYRFA